VKNPVFVLTVARQLQPRIDKTGMETTDKGAGQRRVDCSSQVVESSSRQARLRILLRNSGAIETTSGM
jgi:hypothetical protein